MASFRRLIMRRRRCFLLLCCAAVLAFLGLSGFSVFFDEKNASPVPVLEVKQIEPKFNVLEPPDAQTQEAVLKATRPHIAPPPDVKEEPTKPELKITESVVANVTKHVQNKTEDLEVAKNKTMQQLGVLGVEANDKLLPKVIFEKFKWNLTVSFEDIGNIMKDTLFLNKLKPLNLSGPMLTSTRNRTANFSLSMPIKMGYCDCWEHYCFCCVQLVNSQLHLNVKTCANFTFISKSHNLDLTFKMDNKTVYRGTLSADAPPLLCMGSVPSVADICVHFSNMTYRVDRLAMHKSQLLGCTDFSLNIYNKTISVLPVDCFQIPGDPNHHPKEENLIFPNFVP
ncbi:uncharacterized protein LOC101849236 [Aplysia californica]|uniref:Uncharacterized protein LOC101849236 n=1 Tax=Aplysia californica TaxID=6500 RepID=A0ABM0K2P0_APLCA|nr:uncharacterized protein LOC101849236 [Aplysia californica]